MNDTKNNYNKYIIIAILCIVMVPFAINFYTKGSNDGWLAFLGNYLGGIIGGIGTLLAVIMTTSQTRKIQSYYENNEKDKNKRGELKKISNAVRTFQNRVIGRYLDILNRGEAYNALKRKGKDGVMEPSFINLRTLFEDVVLYNEGEYVDKYYKIKSFYDGKVFGQYNDIDFVFAKDYIHLIEELGLDEDMERILNEDNVN
jgi:hypothetical protein